MPKQHRPKTRPEFEIAIASIRKPYSSRLIIFNASPSFSTQKCTYMGHAIHSGHLSLLSVLDTVPWLLGTLGRPQRTQRENQSGRAISAEKTSGSNHKGVCACCYYLFCASLDESQDLCNTYALVIYCFRVVPVTAKQNNSYKCYS